MAFGIGKAFLKGATGISLPDTGGDIFYKGNTDSNLAITDTRSSAYDIANSVSDPNLRLEMLYNNALINEQRAYNERMSGMQYQLAVEDMKKAGLNPYLFYANGGSGNTILGSSIAPSSYASTAYTADIANKMNKRDNTTRLLTSLLNSVSSAFNIGLQAKGSAKNIILSNALK